MTTLEVRGAAPIAAAPGRTLRGYLLVPRPKDLVKAVVVPLAFAVGAVTEGGVSGGDVARAALVWLVLELLVYQARYQWNDVRGFAADQAHPEAASRGRLPGPLEKARPHIAASLAVLGLRLALTAALAVAVPRLAGLLLALTAGVFGVALVYEHLRSAATGWTSQVPVPLRPALVGLWVAVGAGYAVRGAVGLALAVDLAERPAAAAAAVVAMWALGVVFVTCRWALEAMCFAQVTGRRMVWEVRPDQAREHTVGLLRWLPDTLPPAATTPCDWRALQAVTPARAPWNLALAVASAAAALAGLLLVGGDGHEVVVLLAGAAAAAVATRVPRSRGVLAAALALVLAGLEAALGTPRPLAAAVPVLVVLLAHACFTSQCADEVGRPLRRLQRG